MSILLLKPVDVFLSLCYWYTDSFGRTTLAEPGRLGLRLNFPEPYEAFNLKISFSTVKTLQNSEIYNEIDTATLKCELKIHTSAFGSLTAAMEEDTNQTSRQSRKWRIFHIWKMYLGAQSTLGDTGSLNLEVFWNRLRTNLILQLRNPFVFCGCKVSHVIGQNSINTMNIPEVFSVFTVFLVWV